ncbi:alpha/beta hydrolase [Candidatus Kaiserbacteria bacterium]|nr:alpha/beta hydrolase [Candidatus Kaiserbacteria bacterium]
MVQYKRWGRQALMLTESSLGGFAKRERVIVCVHGMFGGAWYFGPWLERFADAGLGALALDLRGHHDSLLPSGQLLGAVSMSDYTEDVGMVLELLEEAGIARERVILLGHSMGGLIAQMVASRRALGGLVLVASALPRARMGHKAAWDSLALRLSRWGVTARETRGQIQPPNASKFIRQMFAGLEEPQLSYTIGRLVPESAQAVADIVRGIALPQGAKHCPTLIVAGIRDPIVPSGLLYALHQSQASTFHSYPCGHFPMLEKVAPQVVDAIVVWAKQAVSRQP